jgi:hypothetical protein
MKELKLLLINKFSELNQNRMLRNIIRDTIESRNLGNVAWSEISDDSIEFGIDIKKLDIEKSKIEITDILNALNLSEYKFEN